MENKTAPNNQNGNDNNRLLTADAFNSPENQNRYRAIIGYGPVLKCQCEEQVKMNGKNLCWNHKQKTNQL